MALATDNCDEISVTIAARRESWPIAGSFTTARGSKTSAEVVVASISDGELTGVGECLPYARYRESAAATLQQIEQFARRTSELSHQSLLQALPAGSARNALDCALWDLRARRAGRPVWALAGLPRPRPVTTAFTLTLDTPAAMRDQAEQHATRPLLKIKLGRGGAGQDIECLRAIRIGAPAARLIIDANEGWSFDELNRIAPVAADLGVEMIEQPLPADRDDALTDYSSPVPLGADESIGADTDLQDLATRYRIANIKLDKTGGLSHAIAVQRSAAEFGLDVMIGCMVATSLSMAPALLLAQTARFVDLDGPLLLDHDRHPGLRYHDGLVEFPNEPCWGSGDMHG
jgi:L-alanine-DL-glutamate epimerase-like enolase superfamily enzyme